jgi:uncharacterized protein (DUF1778 family)
MAQGTAGRTRTRKRPRSENRQRQGMIAARLSSDEVARVRTAAEKEGVSVSTFVRERVLASA